MLRQEESRRVSAAFAREQASFLSALHGFVRDQVEAVQHLPVAAAVAPAPSPPCWPAKGDEDVACQASRCTAWDIPAAEVERERKVAIEPLAVKDDSEATGVAVAMSAQGLAARTVGKEPAGQRSEDLDDRPDLFTQDTLALEAHNARKTSFPDVGLSDYVNYVKSATKVEESEPLPKMRDGFCAWARGRFGWGSFDTLMCLVIALNAANIGWQIDRELRHKETSLQEWNENVFMGIFLLELCVRLKVNGWRCLKSPAIAFDFALVAVTVSTQAIKPLLSVSGSTSAVQFLEQVMVLRMMRLLRLARAVRLVASFRGLWKLVQGLMNCFWTMASAMILIFIIIYIFACFGAEFITKAYMDDSQVSATIQSHFSSLPHVVLTLFQFVSMDSTAAVYQPLVHRNPLLAIYFLLLLVFVPVALMNLITALLVEEAISSAQMDEEMRSHYTRQKLKQLGPFLRKLFLDLDNNGDGYVQAKEVVDAIRAGLNVPAELQNLINPARMLDLFEALDSDHSGDLSEAEFVDGLSYVAVADVPRETMIILHLLRILRKEVKQCLPGPQSRVNDAFRTSLAFGHCNAEFRFSFDANDSVAPECSAVSAAHGPAHAGLSDCGVQLGRHFTEEDSLEGDCGLRL